MTQLWLKQIGSIIRLEMAKTFLSKRGLWVYLLALGPVLIYLLYSITQVSQRQQRQALAAAHPVSAEAMKAVHKDLTRKEVLASAGEPYFSQAFPSIRFMRDKDGNGVRERHVLIIDRYTDGDSVYGVRYLDDVVQGVEQSDLSTIPKDMAIYATVFQFFYLRLAVFFGCVGVFTNLFRGELLDKSLHFYLLTPVRREVLALGKFLAGLIATSVIFTTSTFLQLAALAWHFSRAEVSQYLAGPGWGHVFAYLGVTMAACLGYGGIFLAAGLMFKNPIWPAATILIWEAINPFLPALLKKISVIFYLQSLCPVIAQPDADMAPLLKALISAAEPVSAAVAIPGLIAVTLVALVIAGRQARRLEINYSAD